LVQVDLGTEPSPPASPPDDDEPLPDELPEEDEPPEEDELPEEPEEPEDEEAPEDDEDAPEDDDEPPEDEEPPAATPLLLLPHPAAHERTKPRTDAGRRYRIVRLYKPRAPRTTRVGRTIRSPPEAFRPLFRYG
jgi:hypothetical protein